MRKTMRLESIRRANQLLYEQTDKMKMLRSQELYSDVLYERQKQLSDKERISLAEKEREYAYHEDLMEQLKEAEELEKEKVEKHQRKLNDIAKSREDQLKEIQRKKDAESAEQHAMGAAMRKEGEKLLEEEKLQQVEMQKKIKQSSLDMLEANARLQRYKDELHAKELAESAKREEEILMIEQRNNAHKALEQRRFEKAQVKRQQIIDAAVQNLTERKRAEHQRLEKQAGELKAKQEREDKDKSEKRGALWKEVVVSRTEQLEGKKLAKAKEQEDEARLVELMRAQVELEDKREREKELSQLETVKTIKALQLAEAVECERKRVEERLFEIEQARVLSVISEQDDQKFREVALQEIEKYRSDGKPVYTLYRALDHKPPDLIPAPRIKVAPRESKATE